MSDIRHSSLNLDDDDDNNELDEDLFLDDVDSIGTSKTFVIKKNRRKKNFKKQLLSEMDEFDIEPSGLNSLNNDGEEDEIGSVTRRDRRKKPEKSKHGEEYSGEIFDEIDDSHYMIASTRGRGIYRGRSRGLRRGRGRMAFQQGGFSKVNYNDRRTSRPSYQNRKESSSSSLSKDDYLPQNKRFLRWKEQQGDSKKDFSFASHRRNSSPDYDRKKRESPSRKRLSPSKRRDSPPRKHESPSRKRESPSRDRDRYDDSRLNKNKNTDNKKDGSNEDNRSTNSEVTNSHLRTLFNKMGTSLGLSDKDKFNFDSLSAEESISLLQNVFTGENITKSPVTEIENKIKLMQKKELTGGSGVLLPPQLQKQMLLSKLESAIQKNTLQDKGEKDENKKETIDMFSDDEPLKSVESPNIKSAEKVSGDNDKRSLSPSRSRIEGNEDVDNMRRDRQKRFGGQSPEFREQRHRSRSRSQDENRKRSPGRHRSRSPYGRNRRDHHDRNIGPFTRRPRSSSRSPVRRRRESPSFHSSRRDYSPRRRDFSPARRHYSPEGKWNYSPHRRRTPPPDRRSPHASPHRRRSPSDRRSPQSSPHRRRSPPSEHRSPKSSLAWEREVRLKSPSRGRRSSSDRSTSSSPLRDGGDRWERNLSPRPQLSSGPPGGRTLSPSSARPPSFIPESIGHSNWHQNMTESGPNPPPAGAGFHSGPPGYGMPPPNVHEGYNMGHPPPPHISGPSYEMIHPGTRPPPPHSRMPPPHPEFPGQLHPTHMRPPGAYPQPIGVPPPPFHSTGLPPDNYYQHHPPPPHFTGPPGWNQPEGHRYNEPPQAVSAPPPPQISTQPQPPPPPPPPRVTGNDDSVIVLSPERNPPSSEQPKVTDPKKDAAVEMEVQNQKLTLSKQRSEYVKKAGVLQHDLDLLKQQKKELLGENSHDNDKIFKENAKLQGELQNKLKAITNVIDMLTGIIGDDKDFITEVDKAKATNETEKKASKSPARRMTPESSHPPASSSSDVSLIKISSRSSTHSPVQKVSKDRPLTPQEPIERDFSRRKCSKSPSSKRRSSDVDVKIHPDKRCRTKSRTPTPKPEPFAGDNNDKGSRSAVVSELAENLQPKTVTSVLPPVPAASTTLTEKAALTPPTLQYNYVHYDPEIHWCRICNVFPRTAKDYLNHLHTTEHKKEIKEQKIQDMPWHVAYPHEEPPHIPNAPTKRVPIRGLQFFISATSWYCKLCNVWIGDLHCASLHLKSTVHSKHYNDYSEENPNWEVDWMSTRTRAYERSTEEKRRMKETSSSSMSRDKSRSGRVSRNIDSSTSSAPGSSMSQQKSNDDSKKKSKDTSNDSTSNKGDLLSKTISKQIIAALNASKKSKKSKKSSSRKSKSSSSSSNSSTSSSSSSSSSDSDDNDPKKSIRVAMRKKNNKSTNAEVTGDKDENMTYVEVPNMKSKWDSPEKEIDKSKLGKFEESSAVSVLPQPKEEDKLLKEWMALGDNEKDKDIILNLKDRLKQKYEAVKECERMKAEKRRKEIREQRHVDSSKKQSEKSKRDSSTSKSSASSSSKASKVVDKNEDKEKEVKKYEDKKQEKPSGGKQLWLPGNEESEDDAEASFEKRALESANKKKEVKKFPTINISKTKLPFIGRMPFMGRGLVKKKSESESGEPAASDSKTDSRSTPSSASPDSASNKNLVWPNLPNVVDKPDSKKDNSKEKEAANNNSNTATTFTSTTKSVDANTVDKSKPSKNIILPKSTLSLSKTPGLPKQLIRMKIPKMKFPDDAIGIEDMDIDNDDEDVIPKETEANLPTDFKDALNILFPSENPEDKTSENQPGEPGSVVLRHQTSEMRGHLDITTCIPMPPNAQVAVQAPPPPVISLHDHHPMMVGPPTQVPPPPVIGAPMDQHFPPHAIMPPQQIMGPVPPPPPHLGASGPPESPIISHPPHIGPQMCPPAHLQIHHPGPPQMHPPGPPPQQIPPDAPPPPMIGMQGHPPPPPPPVPIIGPLLPVTDLSPEDSDRENQSKKRKNPPSQKKRQQLRKIKERLHKEEKELQEKIEEAKKKHLNDEVQKKELARNNAREELAMLGIEEDDMAAQLF